ncbi:odorant receptor 9a-like isoform X2 [Temnothorax americanus]|uniref:odorant receptor 9a-like isoform X2 n=1 Tax=Temnothorax americanus TaxID=1964332 RepID=UPI00406849B2
MDTKVDFEWAVKLNRLTLNLIGLWPKAVPNSRQRLMCNFRVLVIFLGLLFCLIIPTIHSLTRIFGDIILMLDNLQYTLPLISCLIRIVIFWWKKEAMIPVVNMIAEDWIKVKSTQDRSVMIKRARSARIIITFSYCIMSTGAFYLIAPPFFGISIRDTNNITDPGRLLPLQTYYIYDVTNSPQYELTYISQSINIIVSMVTYSGIDNFIGLLVFHICGQLEILNNRLSSFDKCVNFHEIKNCIIKHKCLLRAINVIEDTYNVILLFLFVYFAILFAFYGFRIPTLLDEETDISFPQLVCFIFTVINIFGHMCLYCALGEILSAQCNKIYYAAYSNKWYSMNPKVTHNLLLLMIRGSIPVYLTAGKIFPLTMATFCSLIKTSFGYISVLHTMRS